MRLAPERDERIAVPAWLRYLAIGALIAGAFFRFYHLDWKIYGNDEATTSLRVAGYTLDDYGRTFDGRVRTAAELNAYQRVSAARTAGDTVRSLAVEDPQHPPLYYLLERSWVQLFGNAVATRRALSALVGILVPFAALWLCIELGSALAGTVMFVLVSLSPIQLLYSQTAREYELWALLILVSSALLLRALRDGAASSWLLYAISLVLALYTDVLSILVLLSHGAYAIARARRSLVPFGIAAAVALLAYAPWIAVLLARHDQLTNNSYLHTPLPLKLFALKWAFNAGAVFFDLDYAVVASAVLLLPIAVLLVFAAVELRRRAPRNVVWFIAALTIITAVAFLVPDLVQHESRSTAARYLMPTWLGLELAVSFSLALLLANRTAGARIVATAALTLVVSGALVSNAVSSQARAWWGDGPAAMVPIANIINAAGDPLVVFVDDPQRWDFSPVILSNRLRPAVRFQLIAPGMPVVPASYGETFLLDPSAAQRASIERRGISLTPVYLDARAANANLAKLRAEATAARASSGIRETNSSLWAMPASVRHT